MTKSTPRAIRFCLLQGLLTAGIILASVQEAQTAVRTVSGTNVALAVTPATGTSAWGVEESIPAGLSPSSITGPNGNWNETTRKITWYSTGDSSVSLGYVVSGAAGTYTVSGVANFDGGSNVTILGDTQIVVPSGNSLDISPSSRDHTSGDASGQTIGVTANVSWTATESLSWVTITTGSSGSGNGTITYSITENTAAARTGAITVSGGGITRSFTVDQEAAWYPTISLSPSNRTHSAASASGETILVTANVGTCYVTHTPSWITITSGDSVNDGGTVTYHIDANTSTSSRTGYIEIGQPRPIPVVYARCEVIQLGNTPLAARTTINGLVTGLVSIAVTPPTGTSAWGCEEEIPDGVTPSNITGPNGNWNASTRKLTWYATGDAPATLGYALTGSAGIYYLSGSASFDGSQPVTFEGHPVVWIGTSPNAFGFPFDAGKKSSTCLGSVGITTSTGRGSGTTSTGAGSGLLTMVPRTSGSGTTMSRTGCGPVPTGTSGYGSQAMRTSLGDQTEGFHAYLNSLPDWQPVEGAAHEYEGQ
jgi:hypothetical protein